MQETQEEHLTVVGKLKEQIGELEVRFMPSQAQPGRYLLT